MRARVRDARERSGGLYRDSRRNRSRRPPRVARSRTGVRKDRGCRPKASKGTRECKPKRKAKKGQNRAKKSPEGKELLFRKGLGNPGRPGKTKEAETVDTGFARKVTK